jgi:hypothetical protein
MASTLSLTAQSWWNCSCGGCVGTIVIPWVRPVPQVPRACPGYQDSHDMVGSTRVTRVLRYHDSIVCQRPGPDSDTQVGDYLASGSYYRHSPALFGKCRDIDDDECFIQWKGCPPSIKLGCIFLTGSRPKSPDSTGAAARGRLN